MSKYTCTGKVSDICPNCKNCKRMSWAVYDEKNDGLTEVECEDPYDGMTKTLTADSNICCSMFEMKSEGSCDKISLLQHELEMEKLRTKIHQLEKEKADHLKGIERLQNVVFLQNQVKNLQTTNEESYKREEKLEDKVHKLQRRLLDESKRRASLDTELLTPLARVLYPREAKICKPYSEVIEDIKELRLEKTMKMCNYEQIISNLTESNEMLTNMVERRDRWVKELQSDVYTLQNELLRIRDIAQKAYDDTNRD